MMTKVSRWLLYISSYSFGYILIAISDIIGITDRLSKEELYKSATLLKRIELIFLEDKILFISLLILFFISVMWLFNFKKWKNNTRIHERMEKNCTIEAVGFLFPYVVSMVLVNVGFYGNLVNLLLFFLLGIIFVSPACRYSSGGKKYGCNHSDPHNGPALPVSFPEPPS